MTPRQVNERNKRADRDGKPDETRPPGPRRLLQNATQPHCAVMSPSQEEFLGDPVENRATIGMANILTFATARGLSESGEQQDAAQPQK